MICNSDARLDESPVARDRGFGLVEVIVAMALLMVVALSMLPVFISALNLSKENVSLTTATQLVSEQMDLARGLAATCAAVHGFDSQVLGRQVEDPRGVVLVISMDTEDSCPTSYPSAFRLTVTVTELGKPGDVLAEAETRVMISSAS